MKKLLSLFLVAWMMTTAAFAADLAVTTNRVSSIGAITATLNGAFTGDTPTEVGFEYKPTGSTSWIKATCPDVNASFSYILSDRQLISGYGYTVRAYAIGTSGNVYGNSETFVTSPTSTWCTQTTNEQNWAPTTSQMHASMQILEGESVIKSYTHPPAGLAEGVAWGLIYGIRCPSYSFTYSAKRGSTFTLSIRGAGVVNIAYWADWNGDKVYTTLGDGYGLAWNTAEERQSSGGKKDFVITIPADAKIGLTRIRTYCDGDAKNGNDPNDIGKNFKNPCQQPSWAGSFVDFEINILPETDIPSRTLSVEAKDPNILNAVITGTTDVSKTSSESISATASLKPGMNTLYAFSHWSNKATDEVLDGISPFIYYGSEDITVVANHKYITPSAIRYIGGVWESTSNGYSSTGIAIVPGSSQITVKSGSSAETIPGWGWDITGATKSSATGLVTSLEYANEGTSGIYHYITDGTLSSSAITSTFTVTKPDHKVGLEKLICTRPVGTSSQANPSTIRANEYYLGANGDYAEWGEKFDFAQDVHTYIGSVKFMVAYYALLNYNTPFIARFYTADENGLPGALVKEISTTTGAVFGRSSLSGAIFDWVLPEKVRLQGAFFVTFEMQVTGDYATGNRFGMRQNSTSGSSIYIKKGEEWKTLGSEYPTGALFSSCISLNAVVFAPTPTPTGFASSVSGGNANLTWEAGDADQWQVEYKTPTESAWKSIVVSESSYKLPIGFGATYQVRVSALNNGWRLSAPTATETVTATVEAMNYISNLEELKAWRDYVNAGNNFAGKTVRLTADIDMGGTDWAPVTHANGFSGTFDGQFFALKNMKMTFNDNNPNGFIRFLNSGGVIKKLGIEGIDSPSALTIGTGAGTGNSVFVGQNKGGVIEDSYSKVNVFINKSGAIQFGGFAGNNGANNSRISRCVNYGNITSNATAKMWEVGGVMGEQSQGGSMVESCYNVGTINLQGATESDQAGGITGTIWGSSSANKNTVRNSYNTGAISSSQTALFIVNNGQNGTVTNNYFLSTAGGTATNGTNSGTAISKTGAELMEASMIALLNAGGNDWVADKATPINNGYPILKWQTYGVDVRPVTGITLKTATLNASYTPADMVATEVGFYYRLQGDATWILASASLEGDFSANLTALDEDEVYEFKAFAKFDDKAYKESAVMTFVTRPLITISSSLESSGTVMFTSPVTSELSIRHYGAFSVKATKVSEETDRFIGWFYKNTDELITRDETVSVGRKNEDTELIAKFEATPAYEFTYSWTPTGGGSVVATLEDGSSVASGTSLLEGTKIKLTATMATGYKTVNWNDGQNEMEEINITLSTLNKNMVATFVAIPKYTVTCTVTPNTSWGSVTGTLGELVEGTLLELTASAGAGYEFDQWIIDGYEFGSKPVFQENDDLNGWTVDSPTTVIARFKLGSGVEEQTANGVKVFVVDNKLVVIGAEQSVLTLTNVSGGSLLEVEVTSNEFSVNLPEANGMYLVTLTNAQGAITTFKVTK